MTLYPLKTAVSGILREKWINFLCVLSIATGLFLISAALLFVYNVNQITQRLPERFSIIVFLKDGVTEDGAREIMRKTKGNRAVQSATYISKEDALKELKSIMKDSDYILEGLESNPLPASIEVKLRGSSLSDSTIQEISAELQRLDGVDDIQYGKQLLTMIQSIRKNAEVMGAALVGSLCAGVIFVCYATVKLLLYRKTEEIETLKLLGATRRFIKYPFIMEGGLLGVAGGLVSAGGIAALYYGINFKLTAYLPMLKGFSTPIELLQYSPAAGLLIGLVGAFIAVGRIKF